MTDVEDAVHFRVRFFFVVKVGRLPVDRMSGRRFKRTFADSHLAVGREAWKA
jgi:hypothetical protein